MFTIPALDACKTVEEYASAITSMDERIKEIDTEAGAQPLDDEARAEFAAIQEARGLFVDAKKEVEARRSYVASLAKEPTAREEHKSFGPAPARSRIPENVHDLAEYRQRTSSQEAMTALMRDGAKKAAEQANYPHPKATPDGTVGRIHSLLEQAGDDSSFARLVLATTDPAYIRAFGKIVSGNIDMLGPSERAAVATVGSGNVAAGGYAVPVILDPTIILTSDGSTNPLRQISRVETLTGAGNTWNGVTSSGIDLSYGPAEAGAITSEASFTLGQPTVTVQPVKGEIRYSVEAPEDWPRLMTELARLIQDAKDTLEADQFVNGTGASFYPEGVVYGLDASSQVGTTSDGFDLEDLGRLVGRLPDRFEPRARWLAHRAIYEQIANLDRTSGAGSVYQPLAVGTPPQLLGYPRHNSSAMEDDYTTAAKKIMLFGDFSNFLIVDKVGLTVTDAGFYRNTSAQLTGQRALFIHYRNSSVILVDNAFRLLTVGKVTS